MSAMISYSRGEWGLVEPVVNFLKTNDISVWVDREEIRPNTEWRRQLLRMPRKADAFIPFLSTKYVASEMCRMEFFLARSFDRAIFPVMLEECWHVLDTEEETKYLAGIFAARLAAQKLVGLTVTRDEILSRLLRALQNHALKAALPDHNIYVSYPNGSAKFATEIASALADARTRPWIATMNCEVGEDWRRAQVRAMAKAKAHIIVISHDFVTQNDVLRTEVLMSEAFQLPTLCVMSEELSANHDLSALKQKGARFLFYATNPPEDVTTVRGAPIFLKHSRPADIVQALALLTGAGRAGKR